MGSLVFSSEVVMQVTVDILEGTAHGEIISQVNRESLHCDPRRPQAAVAESRADRFFAKRASRRHDPGGVEEIGEIELAAVRPRTVRPGCEANSPLCKCSMCSFQRLTVAPCS